MQPQSRQQVVASSSVSVELQKLLALNQINLEIWKRILAVSTFNSSSSASPLVSTPCIQEIRTSDVATATIDNTILVKSLASVSFNGSQLQFTYTERPISLKPLAPFWKNITNIFNDRLPDKKYFDLSNILLKYELLDVSKCGHLFAQWKEALEEIQVSFGSVEQTINTQLELSSKVGKMFSDFVGNDQQQCVGLYPMHSGDGNRRKAATVSIQFKVNVNDENLETLKYLAAILKIHFHKANKESNRQTVKQRFLDESTFLLDNSLMDSLTFSSTD